jgi:hypothetical protein
LVLADKSDDALPKLITVPSWRSRPLGRAVLDLLRR